MLMYAQSMSATIPAIDGDGRARALGFDSSAVGLVASTFGRLYSSAFYALEDTRTPVRFSFVRIGVSLILAVLLAVLLPRRLGIEPIWGVAGLTLAGSVAAWVEFTLLRRALELVAKDVVDVADIDRAWKAVSGMPIGPFAMALFLAVLRMYHRDYTPQEGHVPAVPGLPAEHP